MGGSHRPRRALRRAVVAFVLTVATVATGLVATTAPASAAGPWFVAPNGVNSGTCGLAVNSPCLTVTFVIAKAGFASGDVINVAAGTYLDRPVFVTKTADLRGAGAATTIFDGSNVSYALGVAMAPALTLNLSDITLRNGRTNTGGGLAIGGGQVVANDVVLTANNSPLGGGTYVGAGTSLTMTGGSITGNGGTTAGGGVYVAQGGAFTGNGVAISTNTSPFGAGVFVTQGGSAALTGGTLSSNTATATAASLSGAGAGAYTAGKVGAVTGGVLTLTNVTATGNVVNGGAAISGGNGGVVFNAGTATIIGGSFSGNQALASSSTATPRRGQGGAIFNGAQDVDDEPRLSITGTSITGGLAPAAFNGASGGAIANGEKWGVAATPVTNPVLVATDVVLTGNTALYGGGVYNGGALTFTRGSLSGNKAGLGGGAYQNPLVFPGVAATATFDGTSFTGNLADGAAWGLNLPNFGNGGALFNETALAVRNASFSANRSVGSTSASTVAGWGGSIFSGPFANGDAPSLTISDTVIDGGAAAGGNAAIGGGIASPGNLLNGTGATAGSVAATRLTLSNNVALAGGGLFAGGVTTLTDSTVSGNQATHASAGWGGGIYALKSPAAGSANTVALTNTDVADNDAVVVGGGIALFNGTTLAVTGGSAISGNDSVTGGGIYNAGAVTVTDSTLTGNSASFQGGGAYNGSPTVADTPTMTVTDSQVTENLAPAGGGLTTVARATLSVVRGAVSDNDSVGGAGVFVNDNGAATIDGTRLAGNTATGSAGGAILNSGTLTVSRALIEGNTSVHTTGNLTGLGGAIYSGSNNANVTTKLTLDASTISGNHAWAGSALVTYSPGAGSTNDASIDRSTIAGNTSETVFGAIEQAHPLSITNSTFTGNTAVGAPGALSLLVPATVRVAGTIFSGNGGASCNTPIAAVNDGGYNLVDAGDATCGFSAANHNRSGDPQLGLLGNHGGDTPTQVPGPASLALDAIPTGTATTITDAVTGAAVVLCNGSADQRGVARPQGAKCDVGAVEAAQEAPTVDGPDSEDFSIGVAGTSVTFTSTGSPTPELSASGALPPGVSFVDNGDGTATLSGTPTAGPGGEYPITVTAENEADDADHAFTLVLHEAPTISGPAAATYTVGTPGGPTAFSVATGFPQSVLSTLSTLPNGVTFTDDGLGHATIEGTPLPGSGGEYTIVITASNGTPPNASKAFVLTVNEAPAVGGPASDTFTVGAAHSTTTFTATGFPTPTLSAAGLPEGLEVTPTGPGTATISGTPDDGEGGEHDVVVTATNGVGTDATTPIHLVVNEAPEISGPSAARFVAGFADGVAFSADGYPEATLSVSGDLPSGITFVDNGNGTATLEGTAALGTDDEYPLVVRASNGIAPDAELAVTLVIAPPLRIDTTTLPNGAVGTGYGASIAVAGGLPAYSFTIDSGSLPAGLELLPDGSISGTPTGPATTSSFTIRVTDDAEPHQSVTQALSITIVRGVTTLQPAALLLDLPTLDLNSPMVLSAKLTGGSPAAPIAGQTIVFKVGTTTVCTSVTAADGGTVCTMSLLNTLSAILKGSVTASYAGNPLLWEPSSATAPLIAF